MREPKCRGEPMAMPEPSRGLKRLEETDESSSSVITFTTAAMTSLDRLSR
jgi:hypothetical protein